MKVELKEITRGRGSIYARALVSDAANESVQVKVTSPDGCEIPCELYRVNGVEGLVVRLPLLPLAQTVVFASANDAQITEPITIDPGKAKWQSRLNTLVGNSVAKAIRNSETLHEGALTANLTQGYVSQDGREQYRGYVSYCSTDEQAIQANFSFSVLDQQAHLLDGAEVIVLGNNAAPFSQTPTLVKRNVTFAVKLPVGVKFAVLRIDSDVPGIKTFLTIDEEAAQAAKAFTNSIALSAERDPRYEQWLKNKHRVSPEEAAAQQLVQWENPVTFSLIAVGYNGNDELWDGALRSVLAQSYAHFELLIVVAGAAGLPDEDILNDSRVRVVSCTGQVGMKPDDAALMNAGIAAAHGAFLCFMRACDYLEPDFLYCFARGLQECPDALLLYGDEGKLFEGQYVSPLFKPDWNPDLLTSFNYIGRLFAVKHSLLAQLGNLRPEHNGAQEHRIALAAGRESVVPYHVRRIVSQRMWPEELKDSLYAHEPAPQEPTKRVIEEHFEQLGTAVQVEFEPATESFDVRFAVQDEPLVSLVIATKDSVPLLRNCIDSILGKSTYQNIEVIIAENNSTNPATFDYYKEITSADSRVKLHVCQTGGKVDVSAVNNQGIAAASGEYVIILNNDVEVITPDWIERMLGICQRPDVGAVGVKLLYPDGVVQHAGAMMYRVSPHLLQFMGPYNIGGGSVLDDCPYYYNLYNVKQDLSICTSACLMTKKSLYEEMGGYNLEFPTDFDDVDYCLRLRRRELNVVYEPHAKLFHHESVSRGLEMTPQRLEGFTYTNGLLITMYPEYWAQGDLCLSPYLTNKYRGSNFE